MTVYEAMVHFLESSGMFNSQAIAVMESVQQDPISNSMKGRWNDQVDRYDPTLISITQALVRVHAYHWIMDNAPMAWYGAAFFPYANHPQVEDDMEFFLDKYAEVRTNEMAKTSEIPLGRRMIERFKSIYPREVVGA